MEFLKDLLIILAVTLGVGVPLRRLGIPVIAGFIISGILLGPHVLSLVDDSHEVEVLAEIGVALLLFTIGLEISFDKLKRMARSVLLGGGFQVAVTIMVSFAIARGYGFSNKHSLFLGFLVALSSTAIVLKGLQTRGSLHSPYGQFSLAILIFQDLCVIPIMLAVPFLAASTQGSLGTTLWAFLESVGLCMALLLGGRWVVPRLMQIVARVRERELFLLTVIVICFVVALLAHHLGASFALGAFLAGMMVSGTHFRDQAMMDLLPFRELFVSIFFVSLGMFFDPNVFIQSPLAVLILFVSILVGKALLVIMAALLLRLPIRIALISGLILAQVGEFSFIVAEAGLRSSLIAREQFEIFLAAAIPTMLITPLIIRFSPHLVGGLSEMKWFKHLFKLRGVDEISAVENDLRDHIVIAGFGITGIKVVEKLPKETKYVILDTNVKNIEEGTRRGLPIYLGDATCESVLSRLALEHAKMFVVAINDADASIRAIKAAKVKNPKLYVLVRGQYELDRPILEQAGADTVVVAESEAAEKVAVLVTSAKV